MLQPFLAYWTFVHLMQEKDVQKPEIFDPFMIMKQDKYAQLKSDDIIGQIVGPAVGAKREQCLIFEREISSAAVQARVSFSTSVTPTKSYDTEQTQTGAQYTAPQIEGTEGCYGGPAVGSPQQIRHKSQLMQGSKGRLNLQKALVMG